MTSRVPRGQPSARLEAVDRRVQRHLVAPWLHPVADHQREVFEQLLAWWDRVPSGARIELDAGCGTGASTQALALANPYTWVIGVDKSHDRLGRHPTLPPNGALLRGDMIDLWRLIAAKGLRFDATWLLYPNPWPKPGQLARRWHGHPVFPLIVECTRNLELRTNWRIYAEEFAHALARVLGRPVAVERLQGGAPISPFERKYQASAHALWRVASGTTERHGQVLGEAH
jgi:tRNA (guanine-N7-)-methyltransferase